MIPLFSANSIALLSAFTLKPITIAFSPEAIAFMSDSEIGPTPFSTILNSALSLFIFLFLFLLLQAIQKHPLLKLSV